MVDNISPCDRSVRDKLVKILHLKARWIILGAVAVAISAFIANVFIPDAKLAPLVFMIVSVAVLAIILLCDKNDDENRGVGVVVMGIRQTGYCRCLPSEY